MNLNVSWKQVVIVLFILLGLAGAIYLVQVRQIFRSQASVDVNAAFEIKDAQGNVINCNSDNVCQPSSSTISIKLKPNGLSILEN